MSLQTTNPSTHRIYNLANGRGFSNRQVIAAAEQITGKNVPVEVKPRRDGDPAVLVASSQKALDELGWKPEMPELDAMINDAWDYFRAIY